MTALRLEDVQLAGRELVGDDAGGLLDAVDLAHDQVEHVELVEEVDAVLDAVLVQRLQDHVAGAVGRVAGAAHGGLAVVGRVAAEAALVDLAVGRAVERQAHVLEVEDRVDGLLGEDLGGVLVDQVVAALDGVEGVPLPVVVLDVGERRGHAALRRAGVRAGRVQLRDDGGLGPGAGLDGGAHAGTAGADDDDVVLVVVDAVDDGASRIQSLRRCRRQMLVLRAGQNEGQVGGGAGGQGSNVKTTRVPRTSRTAADASRAPIRMRADRRLRDVVVHDRAHAVRAVDQREPEHQHVPHLPERVGHLPPTKPKSMA